MFDETPLVKEVVREKLRNQILSLRSYDSVRIPSERSLSEQLGVSRLSVRAALKKLADEGLLVQVQGRGTYITPLNRLNSVSLICSSDIKSTDPFYNKFLAEIANETARRSINLVMVNSSYPVPKQSGTPIIIIGLLENNILDIVYSSYRPVIALQEYPWLADITQISCDDYKIGCDAVKILYENNHRRILHLAGPEKYPSAFYRKKGFNDAAAKLGLQACFFTGKMNWSGGYVLGELFLRKYDRLDMPTAVFAANDWMAAGFMARLHEEGLRIPDNISLLGCDNIPLSADYTPPLSTFDLNTRQLVMELFKLLDGFSQASSDPPSAGSGSRRIMLPATPVIRESIKKL